MGLRSRKRANASNDAIEPAQGESHHPRNGSLSLHGRTSETTQTAPTSLLGLTAEIRTHVYEQLNRGDIGNLAKTARRLRDDVGGALEAVPGFDDVRVITNEDAQRFKLTFEATSPLRQAELTMHFALTNFLRRNEDVYPASTELVRELAARQDLLPACRNTLDVIAGASAKLWFRTRTMDLWAEATPTERARYLKTQNRLRLKQIESQFVSAVRSKPRLTDSATSIVKRYDLRNLDSIDGLLSEVCFRRHLSGDATVHPEDRLLLDLIKQMRSAKAGLDFDTALLPAPQPGESLEQMLARLLEKDDVAPGTRA